MSDEITPALTPEEWRNVERDLADPDLRADLIIGRLAEGDEDFRAAAAIALADQPFGFTLEMLAALRTNPYGRSPEQREFAAAALANIAALLPPQQ